MIITTIYIFILAVVLAILEIQIEGPHGWAKNLPTWRPHAHSLISRIYGKLMGGKEVTGYHLTMFAFVLMIFFLPYFFGLPLTLINFVKTLSLYFLFVVLWDFLWFVLNPHFPLKEFKQGQIWWHEKWISGIPVDYLVGILVSLLVLLPGGYYNFVLFLWWLETVIVLTILTVMTILFSHFVLKIDTWIEQK